MNPAFQRGACVRLIQKPDGYLSQHYALTVGNTYTCLDRAGCCLIVTTDIEGDTAIVNHERFEPAPQP
ncbi:MAG: hypothetical protein HYS17_08285 [Micavibrio aeruginosavorus]|uniref:Uncharacterized protein n=1 Tax=Micavibrio aeruginosavorus TaxID=349221 RepID=A0A7T5UFT6_9BACT|nr:MAG: hypothetical protein HYS17_08285 [Micavibrio aeruginosavorus]